MKTFEVRYGDYRDPGKWKVEAKSKENAKTLFRQKFGFNSIKIQEVVEVK